MTLDPIIGVGVGLRQAHYQHFLNGTARVPWLEILSDNYCFSHGLVREKLCQIREHYPMVMHGVGLNIGSADPINTDYLNSINRLAEHVAPSWISDHLCWTGIDSTYSHDLLPLPYTEEALEHVVQRIWQVQEVLKRPLLLENVSSYLSFSQADYSEAEFINAVAKRSGCFILLDINNIYVSACNHGYQATEYLQQITPSFVKQFHLAGFEQQGDLLIDTHGAKVNQAVWDLYAKALDYFPATPTNIEWDNNIPSWDVVYQEVQTAEAIFLGGKQLDYAC